jgi:hypothetical protein
MTGPPEPPPDPTAERLAAIRERADAATPGPWFPFDAYPLHTEDEKHAAARIGPVGQGGITGSRFYGEPTMDLFGTAADLQFAAQAREDIPWLLEQLRLAAADRARLEKENAVLGDRMARLSQRLPVSEELT